MAVTSSRLMERFRIWLRRSGASRKAAFALAALATLSGGATIVALVQDTGSEGADAGLIQGLMILDFILLALLTTVVAYKLITISVERRKGTAGSGLQVRLVLLFALVAVVPAALVAVMSFTFLNLGLQAWFSDRVSTAVERSTNVADAYLSEHRQNLRSDLGAVANVLNGDAIRLIYNPLVLENVLGHQADLHAFPEAMIIDRKGEVLAKAGVTMTLRSQDQLLAALERADDGDIAVIGVEADMVRAVIRLNRFGDAYLAVGRFIDPEVLSFISSLENAVSQYKDMEQRRTGIQVTFGLIFIVAALLLLLAAMWIGLNFASQIASPVRALIQAAERVREGDLGARVDASRSSDEIGTLSRAFNRMTSQLESQRLGLMEANRELDERRRFTETVLTGVSAGVIGLDSQGRITLPNRSASELLQTDFDREIGQLLAETTPELAEIIDLVVTRPDRQHQAEVALSRNGNARRFLVRAAAEQLAGEVVGYVITFDDVTDLVSAQRKAAWADVARRIAHEIKNPLTPIQLSAERLKRKYLSEVTSDPDTFVTCTDTIVRQVGDIGRMVDEFSSFARMPQPVMARENLTDLVRQAVFLEQNRNTDIEIDLRTGEADIFQDCDGQQVSRALTNLLKNAAESIKTRVERSGGEAGIISVEMTLPKPDGSFAIEITDNGQGLPKENRDRLTEPYVTHSDKGTGLGLAIVMKIMEDHNGELRLEDAAGDGPGAKVSLVFHKQSTESHSEDQAQGEAVRHGG